MNYTLPDHQAGAKYSAFTYLHIDSKPSDLRDAYNFTSPEMLYCSSSSGEHFEQRAKELRGAKNVTEGILTFSTQTTTRGSRMKSHHSHL